MLSRRNFLNASGAILGASAIASIASDMGFRWEITRGFALIGRVLGALAHIQEEMDEPISDRRIPQKMASRVPMTPNARIT